MNNIKAENEMLSLCLIRQLKYGLRRNEGNTYILYQ
jgi:hypothetical protein